MSVLPKELMRKLSADSHETSERISKPNARHQRFRELMKVSAIDDKPREKHVYSRHEEKKDTKKAPSPTGENRSSNFAPPDNNDAAILAASGVQTALLLSSAAGDASQAPAASADFSLQIEALFERMASNMILMTTAGETETTLFLDNPQFASSVFFGSQITIREFSTAPKAFNVEISSSAAAIATLDAGKQSLLAAFQNGNFNFSVHRIDSHVQSQDRPVFHRKESGDQDQQEQKGGREQ